MRKIIYTIFVLFILTTAAPAQDARPRAEVFGSIGGGSAGEDEGGLGGGLDIGGGIGFRLAPKWGVEGQINRLHHQRNVASGVRFEGTDVVTTASLLYHFSTSRVQPYMLYGAGVIHHDNRSMFPGTPSTFQDSKTHFIHNLGGGVKIFVNKRISIRPEARIFVENGLVYGIFRASVAVGYHW